jgi:hypothetical protein
MSWIKTHPANVLYGLPKSELSPAEMRLVDRAATELEKGFAPQTTNHRAALLEADGLERVGVNTDTAQRGKQCAEPNATTKLQIAARFKKIKLIEPKNLVILSKRFPNLQTGRPSQKEPPTGPCGSCLSHIQAQSNFTNLEGLNVIMGAGNSFNRAKFGDLYPIPSISALRNTIERSHYTHGATVTEINSCCEALDPDSKTWISQNRFNELYKKVRDDLKFSDILSAPGLKISYGYLTERGAKKAERDTMPLIEIAQSPIGHVSGILTLLSSSDFSRSHKRLKGLVIAVEASEEALKLAGNYQFFTGPERQRVFDLADLTNFDIPVFITWGREIAVVANISALTPLFEGPTVSGSSAKNLPFYTR